MEHATNKKYILTRLKIPVNYKLIYKKRRNRKDSVKFPKKLFLLRLFHECLTRFNNGKQTRLEARGGLNPRTVKKRDDKARFSRAIFKRPVNDPRVIARD